MNDAKARASEINKQIIDMERDLFAIQMALGRAAKANGGRSLSES